MCLLMLWVVSRSQKREPTSGLLLACVSSFRGKTIPKEWVIFGEVGLSGEVRPVASGHERIREAAKHGFKKAIVPSANAPKHSVSGIEVCRVERISQVLELFDES